MRKQKADLSPEQQATAFASNFIDRLLAAAALTIVPKIGADMVMPPSR